MKVFECLSIQALSRVNWKESGQSSPWRHTSYIQWSYGMKLIKAHRLSHREALTDDLASTTGRSSGRWFALIVLCLGALMIVLDTTIVNVALPSIRQDLGFSQTSLAWVVNAYLLTFGGFLLLGGRLGDLFGHRRLFLIKITLFSLASLACRLANSQMLLGGLLTNALNWHWIFLVNLPIGVAVFALCLVLLPADRGPASVTHLDVAGAVTVTASLMLAVFAIVNGNETGWMSAQTIGLLAAAAALLALFLSIEARVRAPLMPLSLLRLRNVATANVVGVLWAAAMFAWFFLSALYLQLVLGFSPLQVGLAFL